MSFEWNLWTLREVLKVNIFQNPESFSWNLQVINEISCEIDTLKSQFQKIVGKNIVRQKFYNSTKKNVVNYWPFLLYFCNWAYNFFHFNGFTSNSDSYSQWQEPNIHTVFIRAAPHITLMHNFLYIRLSELGTAYIGSR